MNLAQIAFSRKTRGDMWHSLVGQAGYMSGTAGSVTLPPGSVLLKIAAQSNAGGSFSFLGGATIPIPAMIYPIELEFNHTLWQANAQNAGTITFTSTNQYFVHYVNQRHA
jgi:hypothetical protein